MQYYYELNKYRAQKCRYANLLKNKLTKSDLLYKFNIIQKQQKFYKKSVDKVEMVWYHNQVA